MVKVDYGRITDIKHTDDGLVYVRVINNKGIVGGKNAKDVTADKTALDPLETNKRTLKNRHDADAGVEILTDRVSISGNSNNKIESTKDYGNLISGPTTFTAHPEAIRLGGVYRLNGLMTSTIPSTIVTPVPTLILDIPGGTLLSLITGVVNTAKSILGV